jgi:hypothetical protein
MSIRIAANPLGASGGGSLALAVLCQEHYVAEPQRSFNSESASAGKRTMSRARQQAVSLKVKRDHPPHAPRGGSERMSRPARAGTSIRNAANPIVASRGGSLACVAEPRRYSKAASFNSRSASAGKRTMSRARQQAVSLKVKRDHPPHATRGGSERMSRPARAGMSIRNAANPIVASRGGSLALAVRAGAASAVSRTGPCGGCSRFMRNRLLARAAHCATNPPSV